ncbi:hypothetical protein N826_07715 [Skermanella aerolata KACC 11604]|nr:hypothetical protein N826_07715 [Skermanella aerolata KACC 11604]
MDAVLDLIGTGWIDGLLYNYFNALAGETQHHAAITGFRASYAMIWRSTRRACVRHKLSADRILSRRCQHPCSVAQQVEFFHGNTVD